MNDKLKQKLLSKRPKPRSFEIDGDTFYIRIVTVGDINYEINQRDKTMEVIAFQKGYEIDDDNRETVITNIGAEYTTAMNIARYLCDSKGNLLFDVRNVDDLDSINALPKELLSSMENAVEADIGPKL